MAKDALGNCVPTAMIVIIIIIIILVIIIIIIIILIIIIIIAIKLVVFLRVLNEVDFAQERQL